jgi:hypothetical protein
LFVDVCPGGERWIERWSDRLVIRDRESLEPVEEIPFDSPGIAASGPVTCLDSRGDSWIRGDESIYNVIESVAYRLGVPGATGARSGTIDGAWTEVIGAGNSLYGIAKGTGLAAGAGVGASLQRQQLRDDSTPETIDLGVEGSAGAAMSRLVGNADGSMLAVLVERAGGGGAVVLVDAATGKPLRTLERFVLPEEIGFALTGQLVVLEGEELRSFDPATGREMGDAQSVGPESSGLPVDVGSGGTGDAVSTAVLVDGTIHVTPTGSGRGEVEAQPFGKGVAVREIIGLP